MVVKLNVSRTQWAVGNGFFHSGRIESSASAVDYVYDCGALDRAPNQASLQREVGVSAERTQHIRLLFLSHFDFDHVSGLPSLIAGATVDRFFIPMVPAVERLLTFAANLTLGLTEAPPDVQGFYEELIINPPGALTSLTQGQAEPASVVVIGPTTSADIPLNRGVTEAPEGLTRDEVAGAQLDANLILDVEPARITASTDGEVVWEWVTFVAQQALDASPAFVSALIRAKLITDARDLDQPAQVNDLVRNHRELLTDAYEEAMRTVGSSFNKNLTSMMLYSGPPPNSRSRVYRARANPAERAEIGAWGPRPGWLGLGDADLRSKARVNEVNTAFHSRKPLVGTFAPSHHGARDDWKIELLQGFDPDPTRLPTHVFGASGAYGHPHDEVIRGINEAGATTVVVGLRESSRWTEALSVYVGAKKCRKRACRSGLYGH
ncbi:MULTISPECIES: hypothetical protein [Microbacterium]|uniref:hypothetical protein n=1 Tax=Microbacterium TaxID=33882 RepID=UPI0027814727|nr:MULTISPECIES: hypothetical protein [Microbacterium]MDQ1082262.1 hypothetical protein [Microbacterium sp. SORGH_AS_0344]MDQ1168967.1 hypothetical protein [Microbacterium proteolyticum]